jgi:hypothetical protein
MTRKFKTNEEISPRELVQYGFDHLGAGATLFKGTPEHYDSAGYLIHIGYECPCIRKYLGKNVGNQATVTLSNGCFV